MVHFTFLPRRPRGWKRKSGLDDQNGRNIHFTSFLGGRFWTSEVGTWPRALLDGGRLEHDHNQSLPQVTSRAPARPYALAESWPVAASMLQVPACFRHLEHRPSRPSSTSVIRRPFLMPRLAMDSAGAVLIAEPQFPTSNFQTCSLTDLGKLTLHFQTANSRLPASIGAERGLG